MASEIRNQLSILQYNVGRGRATTNLLFNDPSIKSRDIIALQEPYYNRYNGGTHNPAPAKEYYHLVHTPSPEAVVRTATFVSRRIPRDSWHVTHESRNLQTICFTFGEGCTLYVHNIYNPNRSTGTTGSPGVATLRTCLDQLNGTNPGAEHLVVGDFNLKSPRWEGNTSTARGRRDTEERLTNLYDIMENQPLSLLLRKGTITRDDMINRTSTIDLSFGTPGVASQLIKCATHEREGFGMNKGSDHFPVETLLNLRWQTEPSPRKRKWTDTNQKILLKTLSDHLPTIPIVATKLSIELYVKALIEAIDKAINDSTPWTCPSPYAKSRVTREVKEAIDRKTHIRHKIDRKYRKKGLEVPQQLLDDYRRARKTAKAALTASLTKEHREKVTKASESMGSVWKLAKWAKNRDSPFKAYTPPIEGPDGLIFDPEKKADLFANTFFPIPPVPDLSDIPASPTYPQGAEWANITRQEVEGAVKHLSTGKSPGPDAIPSEVIKLAIPVLLEPLTWLFNQCVSLGYHPKHFRKSITVIIRKVGKGDYSQPKAYRPIALLNILGKVLEAIIAARIGYLADTHAMLPAMHMGGRKGTTVDAALHCLLGKIYTAKAARLIATILFLDVSGAYDNVAHERLIHNLRKRGMCDVIVNFIASFISERSTDVRLPEYTLKEHRTDAGVPQGSPLSSILYLFYNADLIEACNDPIKSGSGLGYVDDVCMIVTGRSVAENLLAMEEMHERTALWARRHASVFNPTKYQLVHFGEEWSDAPLIIPGHDPVPAKESAKYLGVIFDWELSWGAHLEDLEKKTSKRLAAISALASSTWGIGIKELRHIYIACIRPLASFGVSAWLPDSTPGGGQLQRHQRTIMKLEALQKQASKAIFGGYTRVAGEAYNIELNLLPIDLHMELASIKAALRLISAPLFRQPEHQPSEGAPLARLIAKVEARIGKPITNLELKRPYIRAPWDELPFAVIAKDELSALIDHERLIIEAPALTFYSDGSGIDGHIGAAAVCPDIGAIRRRYLGKAPDYTVYSAELVGIILALEVAIDVQGNYPGSPVRIFVDNQSAIQSAGAPKSGPCQFLLVKILELKAKLNTPLSIHWIPAHVGVPGNEAADAEAKTAARSASQPPRVQPQQHQLPDLIAPIFAAFKNMADSRWDERWEKHKHGAYLRRIQPHRNPKAMNKFKGLTRPMCALLVQIRTGKIGLSDFLHSVKRAETDRCNCPGTPKQTAEHILTTCPNWSQLREDTLWTGIANRDMRTFLREPTTAKRAAMFMAKTGLLGQLGIACLMDTSDQEAPAS